MVFVACGLESGSAPHAHGERREVVVNGKSVRMIDILAHCASPEALALMGKALAGPGLRTDLDMASAVDLRLQTMDAQGIDMQALSVNPNWYRVTDQDLAS
jgi:aminocarboxymuconate-semialdehyde decarboxylase